MERGKRTSRFNPTRENLSDLSSESLQRDGIAEQEEPSEQEGWDGFLKSKQEIEALQRELLPVYLQYRKLLVEGLKELCQESGVTNFNTARLEMEWERESDLSDLAGEREEGATGEQKQELMDKILQERQVKRYYKNRQEGNELAELDQENDQELVYQIYREAFGENQSRGEAKRVLTVNNSQQQQPSSRHAPSSRRPAPLVVEPPNYLNFGNFDVNNSPKHQPNNSPKYPPNLLSGGNMQMAVDHELSFDQDNEQYFSGGNMVYDQRQQVVSEANYELTRMRKNSQRRFKQQDQLSHADDIYKNFLLQQQQQLAKQKLRVQKLSDTATKVINNEIEFEEEEDEKNVGKESEEDSLAQLRYLMGEVVDLFAAGECLKFFLKFRSYQVLDKLYANASTFYGEEIRFAEPFNAKHFMQILQAVMPEDEQFVRVVIANIFGDASDISYQEFMDRLCPVINDKEFELLQGSKGQKTFDATVRLFVIWSEMDYFEKEINRLWGENEVAVDKFVEVVAEKTMLSVAKISDFLTRGKSSRVSRLKAELYFRKVARLSVNGLRGWAKTRKAKVVARLQEQSYQHYYMS